MERMACLAREQRAVGPTLPADGVDAEALLERRSQLFDRAHDRELRVAALLQAPHAPPMLGAALRAALGAIGGIEAVRHQHDRGLDALMHYEVAACGTREPAVGGQAEH